VLTPDDNFVSDQSAIACPTLSQCTAVIEGGQHHAQLTFNPLKPTSPILGPIHTPGSELDIDYDGAWIACPSAQECVAVFGTPDESVFDPQVRRTASLVRVVPGTQELLAIACPSSSRCVAVGRGQNEMGDVGPEAVFAPSLPNDAVTTRLAPSTGLQAVACPSATQCTAVDYTGAEITFAPLIPRHG
jgi:hypothetical protein